MLSRLKKKVHVILPNVLCIQKSKYITICLHRHSPCVRQVSGVRCRPTDVSPRFLYKEELVAQSWRVQYSQQTGSICQFLRGLPQLQRSIRTWNPRHRSGASKLNYYTTAPAPDTGHFLMQSKGVFQQWEESQVEIWGQQQDRATNNNWQTGKTHGCRPPELTLTVRMGLFNAKFRGYWDNSRVKLCRGHGSDIRAIEISQDTDILQGATSFPFKYSLVRGIFKGQKKVLLTLQ